MKKKSLITIILFTAVAFLPLTPDLTGQDLSRATIYEKETVPYRKPVPLPHLREADIPWSTLIWRMVDLREKMNHPLYYPTEPIGSRMSLIDVLVQAVENGELTVYDNEEFIPGTELTWETVRERLGAETTVQAVIDVDTGEETMVQIEGEPRTFEVQRYLMLEQWYFDKRHSRFGVRTLGFCPIRVWQRPDDLGEETEETLQRQTFWVYYPDAREILARQEVLTNTKNMLSSISFDDIFLQRRYSGYIYRQSNIFDNRAIMDYATGRDALYESQRIHDALFNFEQDLWEY